LLQRITDALHLPLGNLAAQWKAWRARDSYDAIYAPCQTETGLLCCLRGLGLFRVPICIIVHHPPLVGRMAKLRKPLARLILSGTDACCSLSATLARELDALGHRGDTVETLPWGPDVAFYPMPEYPGEGIFSAGRTGRDWKTLGQAAMRTGVNTKIVCLDDEFAPAGDSAAVQVFKQSVAQCMTYPTLLELARKARALAIPLNVNATLLGLTSLTDALALGKPVIITKHPLCDIDVEQEGIGFALPQGDVEAWARAVQWVNDHPAEAEAMGRRARALADTRYNTSLFARRLVAIMQQITNAQGTP